MNLDKYALLLKVWSEYEWLKSLMLTMAAFYLIRNTVNIYIWN